MSGDIDEVMADVDTEDALAEFDFLVSDGSDRLRQDESGLDSTDGG